jgi:hypothetical protein
MTGWIERFDPYFKGPTEMATRQQGCRCTDWLLDNSKCCCFQRTKATSAIPIHLPNHFESVRMVAEPKQERQSPTVQVRILDR